jgi:hypothetical protein
MVCFAVHCLKLNPSTTVDKKQFDEISSSCFHLAVPTGNQLAFSGKLMPLAGLEPALFGLEVRRIVHYATGAFEPQLYSINYKLRYNPHQLLVVCPNLAGDAIA